MRQEHLTFEELSELLDDSLTTVRKRELSLEHIECCPQCKNEYNLLMEMKKYFRVIRREQYNLEDLSHSVIMGYRSSRRNAFFARMVSFSAAAAVFIAFGTAGLYSLKDSTAVSEIAHEQSQENTLSDTEEILNILRESDGRVYRISEQFIEAEVPVSRFISFKRKLGFRKMLWKRSTARAITQNRSWRKGIETVGASNGPILRDMEKKEEYVRVRVFR